MAQSYEIVIANRQRTRRLDRKFIKRLIELTLKEVSVAQAEIGFHFVSAREMAKVHEEFMNISGSTDVITFDHASKPPEIIHGEIFISIDDAIAQAREFRTSWQSEVVRYVIHGILHLLGHDDLESKARGKMKREENRLVKRMEKQFDFRALERT